MLDLIKFSNLLHAGVKSNLVDIVFVLYNLVLYLITSIVKLYLCYIFPNLMKPIFSVIDIHHCLLC